MCVGVGFSGGAELKFTLGIDEVKTYGDLRFFWQQLSTSYCTRDMCTGLPDVAMH